jgi:hypothetical protein
MWSRRPQFADEEFLGRDDLPAAWLFPPVGVVVLDASRESALLVDAVLDRGIRVVAPRSLLAGRTEVAGDAAGVVIRWRVRWDVPLAALLRRAVDGEGSTVPGPLAADGATIVLEPGPAFVRP